MGRLWRSLAINLDEMRRVDDAILAWRCLHELTNKTRASGHPMGPDEALQRLMANPESAERWTALATAYRYAGRGVEAISIARTAIDRSPRTVPYTIAIA